MPTYEEIAANWAREQARRKREGPAPKSEQRRAQRLIAAKVAESTRRREEHERDTSRRSKEAVRANLEQYLYERARA
jgi:hypothetical protein